MQEDAGYVWSYSARAADQITQEGVIPGFVSRGFLYQMTIHSMNAIAVRLERAPRSTLKVDV